MSTIERAAVMIQNIEYMSIASVCPETGAPWNTGVYTAYDEDLKSALKEE